MNNESEIERPMDDNSRDVTLTITMTESQWIMVRAVIHVALQLELLKGNDVANARAAQAAIDTAFDEQS